VIFFRKNQDVDDEEEEIEYVLFKGAIKGQDPDLEEHGRQLSRAERAWFAAQQAAWLSVWEVVDVEPGYDVHLVGRIARERYAAQLSLVRPADGEFFVFAGEELAGRRVLDFAALVDHLANKLDWVTALPNDDHVARFRIVGLAAHPERLDEVIGEIAMGRSILER